MTTGPIFWQRRLDRRRMLRTTAVGGVGLGVLSLLGCRDEARPVTESTSASPEQQPKRGGTVTHWGGAMTEARGLDPHVDVAVAGRAYGLWYQTLLGYNARTYDLEPELAQKWEQPSQTEYIFTLSPGVKWHNKQPANGRALTVDDIIFSLRRIRTNEPRFRNASLLAGVDKIEAVGSDKLRITTQAPNASLLTKLSGDPAKILNPEVVERAAGRFTTAEVVVGTGAFILQSVQERVSSESVRNPDYWKPGLPYLDRFRTLDFRSNDQIAYAAFAGGQIDITRVPGPEVKSYIAQQGPGFEPYWFKEQTLPYTLPNTKVKPFDDVRVRRAMRLLFDHEEFRNSWCVTWHGREGRYGSIIPNALDAWDLTEEEYKNHIFWRTPKDAAAREAITLLNAAGFTRENPLRFEITGMSPGSFLEAMTVMLQSQWKQLSQGIVDPQVRVHETPISFQLRANREFAYFSGGTDATTSEVDAWLSELYRTGASQNYGDYSDPRLDDMIDKQRAIFDVRQRKAAVRDLILYALDQVPTVTTANRFFLVAAKPQIRGYAPEFNLMGRQYEKVWLDT